MKRLFCTLLVSAAMALPASASVVDVTTSGGNVTLAFGLGEVTVAEGALATAGMGVGDSISAEVTLSASTLDSLTGGNTFNALYEDPTGTFTVFGGGLAAAGFEIAPGVRVRMTEDAVLISSLTGAPAVGEIKVNSGANNAARFNILSGSLGDLSGAADLTTAATAFGGLTVGGSPFGIVPDLGQLTQFREGTVDPGFEVTRIGPTVVPVPAGVVLIGSAVLGLGALSFGRRRKVAA